MKKDKIYITLSEIDYQPANQSIVTGTGTPTSGYSVGNWQAKGGHISGNSQSGNSTETNKLEELRYIKVTDITQTEIHFKIWNTKHQWSTKEYACKKNKNYIFDEVPEDFSTYLTHHITNLFSKYFIAEKDFSASYISPQGKELTITLKKGSILRILSVYEKTIFLTFYSLNTSKWCPYLYKVENIHINVFLNQHLKEYTKKNITKFNGINLQHNKIYQRGKETILVNLLESSVKFGSTLHKVKDIVKLCEECTEPNPFVSGQFYKLSKDCKCQVKYTKISKNSIVYLESIYIANAKNEEYIVRLYEDNVVGKQKYYLSKDDLRGSWRERVKDLFIDNTPYVLETECEITVNHISRKVSPGSIIKRNNLVYYAGENIPTYKISISSSENTPASYAQYGDIRERDVIEILLNSRPNRKEAKTKKVKIIQNDEFLNGCKLVKINKKPYVKIIKKYSVKSARNTKVNKDMICYTSEDCNEETGDRVLIESGNEISYSKMENENIRIFCEGLYYTTKEKFLASTPVKYIYDDNFHVGLGY